MGNVQLLENTEKTVGGPKLFEQHERVRSSGADVVQLRTRIAQLETQHQTEVNKNASVESEVNNHYEKEKLDKEIEQLKTRKLWFQYTEVRQQHLLKKKAKDALNVELKQLKERW